MQLATFLLGVKAHRHIWTSDRQHRTFKMKQFVILLLCLVVLTVAAPQNKENRGGSSKNKNRDRLSPEEIKLCEPFQQATLVNLLNNPPPLPVTTDLLTCFPRKLIREFTAEKSPHVSKVLKCMKSFARESCPVKGYKIIANTLIDYFNQNQAAVVRAARTGNAPSTLTPKLRMTLRLLNKNHRKALSDGFLILTENEG